MGWRFRRSLRLGRGLRLNLGKRSASVSLGGRGLHTTFGGPQGRRTTIGLPGSGLSYTTTRRSRRHGPRLLGLLLLALALYLLFRVLSG